MSKQLILLIFIGTLFAARVDVCIDPGHGGVDPGAVNYDYGTDGVTYEKIVSGLLYSMISYLSILTSR